jgi:hypothetical protein
MESARTREHESTRKRRVVNSSLVLSCSLLLALSVLLGGCARLIASYDIAPNGLTNTDNELRRLLAFGHADSALLRLEKPRKKAQLPKDDLLRVLYEGLAAHYAGDYARSTVAFDVADYLADDRLTTSLSQTALSLTVNDLSLAWKPSRTERLMIPYYGALSYLHAGKYQDAAVEVRRLSYLLQVLQDDDKAPPAELHAFLRNFAGVVFEAAGYYQDADVAYRNAMALDSVQYQRPKRAAGTGEVVVLIEHGFAPYRVQESLIVSLNDHDYHEFEHDDDDRRRASSFSLAARVLEHASTSGPRVGPPRSRILTVPAPLYEKSSESEHHHHKRRCEAESADSTRVKGERCEEAEDEDHSYVLRMSWPVMYDYDHGAPLISVVLDTTVVAASLRADIGRGVLEDFRREQAAIVARAIARAVAKYAMTKGLEEKAGEKNEGLGKLAGTLANIGTAITEQADTRSWHFVPRSISLVRYPLPPGQHHIKVDHGNGAPIDLGSVSVAAGRVTVLSTRVWN